MSTDVTTLQTRYEEVRAYTERLAAPLSPEDQTVQSMPDVSPTKWHRAHVTWFFETFVLAENEQRFAPYQDQYWFLFNSYYEAIGPRYARPMRGVISRPGAHDVGSYRGNVDDALAEQFGDWLFGCDVCQEVCPWNRRAPASPQAIPEPMTSLSPADLVGLLQLDEAGFRAQYRHTPLWRAKPGYGTFMP